MMDNFLSLVDAGIRDRSGSVFYSRRAAFASASTIYILGLNPGGDPVAQARETVGRNVAEALGRKSDAWSEYSDESWLGRPPGTHGMQPRVLHLMRRLGLDPRRVPSSNVVFVRSAREADLKAEKGPLLRACWPVHQAVIEALDVRVVVCFGGTAGRWVRDALHAHQLVDQFIEDNARRWTNRTHAGEGGRRVLTLTHPSIADWTAAATDPTALVTRALENV